MRPACFLCVVLCAAQEPPTFRAGVSSVRVAVSVMDRDGRPVRDLRAEDFILLDNGKPRAIESMWREDNTPLTVGLVEDISGSQLRFIAQHRDALVQFVKQVLRPQDQTFLVGVAANTRLFADYTNSASVLQEGIAKLSKGPNGGVPLGLPCHQEGRRCGGSAIWNGVSNSARLKMKGMEGRNAMILLTDGIDTGSPHGLVDAIEAAQSADTLVYTIQYSGLPPGRRSPALPVRILLAASNGKARKSLGRLARETGARSFDGSQETPEEIFSQIEEELRNLYVLTFTLSGAGQDGKFHNLEVKSKRRGVQVRARRGYTATASESH